MGFDREGRRVSARGVELFDYGNPGSHGFYISLFVRAGSMHEAAEENGITHFLEHALIRNLNQFYKPSGVNPYLDRYGLELGASTFSEMVQFFVCGSAAAFGRGAELITALLRPLSLPVSELDAERERIKAEIRENDERGSLTNFTNELVHAGTSLSRPITGNRTALNRIRLKQLEAYRRRVFSPENLFLYVTGNYKEADLTELLRLVDERLDAEVGFRQENLAPRTAAFGKREGRVYLKNADFTLLRLTFDMDMARLGLAEVDLIYDMLIGGNNAILFRELSELRGICYDVQGATERYNNTGSFTISLEVRENRLYEAAELVLRLLREFTETLYPEQALMKASYVDNAYLLYDDMREMNFTFAYDNHILGQSVSSISERSALFASVTPEAIREAASSIFKKENLTVTLKGKKRSVDLARLEEILRNF